MISQSELLVEIMKLLVEKSVCPLTSHSKWPKIILDTHTRGYLYADIVEDKLNAVICAYRIPEGHDLSVIPDKESGTTLYIPWAASRGMRNPFIHIMALYLRENHIIDQIKYHRRGDMSQTITRRVQWTPAHQN